MFHCLEMERWREEHSDREKEGETNEREEGRQER